MKLIKFLYFTLFFTSLPMSSYSDDLIDLLTSHTLTLNVAAVESAYGEVGRISATGFWVGGKSELIVTNAHVAAPGNPGEYTATDSQGNSIKLDLVYSNPIWDLAYLVPQKGQEFQVPNSTFPFNFSPQRHQEVFMTGNNGGIGISLCRGTISDISTIVIAQYLLPSISVSLNGREGSSGSAVLDKEGKLIGVNYSSGNSSTFVIPASFLEYDLSYLERKELPPVYELGIIFKHIFLTEAQRYFDFPKDMNTTTYNKKFPQAQGRLLQVSATLKGFPDAEKIKAGDIVLKINEKEIGGLF